MPIGIFFSGIFIIGGLGLTFVRMSRLIGISLISSSILIIFSTIMLNTGFPGYHFLLGVIIGLIITGFFVYSGNYNKLAFTIRVFLAAFIVISIIYEFSFIYSNVIGIWAIGIFLVSVLLFLAFFTFFSYNLYSINSRDSVIIGPKGSGRSHLIPLIAKYSIEYRGSCGISIPLMISPYYNEDTWRRFSIDGLLFNLQQPHSNIRPLQKDEFVIYKMKIWHPLINRNLWLIIHDSDFMSEIDYLFAINRIRKITQCPDEIIQKALNDIEELKKLIVSHDRLR